jgi:hypothetical protein
MKLVAVASPSDLALAQIKSVDIPMPKSEARWGGQNFSSQDPPTDTRVEELGDLNIEGAGQLGEQTNLRFALSGLDERELARCHANSGAQILQGEAGGLPNVTNSLT